jgi:carboxypeptidase C (cathepsin A)
LHGFWLGLPSEQRHKISMAYYEAGHLLYIHRPSLEKLKADLAAIIDSAAPGR